VTGGAGRKGHKRDEKGAEMAHQSEIYFEDYKKFMDILIYDASAAQKELTQSDTQGKGRTYVRAVFALFEGDTFQRKRLALMRHEQAQEEFSEAELALLREEQYVLTKTGEVKIQKKFLKLADNLRFSFRAVAKAFRSGYELNVGGSGWESFRKAVDIRNRIVHPKCLSDLEVTEEDIEHIRAAVAWYQKSALDLFKSCVHDGTRSG